MNIMKFGMLLEKSTEAILRAKIAAQPDDRRKQKKMNFHSDWTLASGPARSAKNTTSSQRKLFAILSIFGDICGPEKILTCAS